jgi:4-amino-4-deoxy-L-arabinose transferase-like glycosyltransferase
VFLFFSASDSKLVPYILPIFPTLALLIASAAEESQVRDLRRTAWLLIVAGIGFVGVAAFLPQLLAHSDRAPYWMPTRIPAFLMGVALLAGGLAARRRDRDSTALTAYIGTSAYAAFALLLYAATHVSPLYSGRDLVEQLPRELAASPDPLYSVRTYDHSLTFYLGREATLVEYRGELDFGLTLRPERELGLVEWMARWNTGRQALAVLDEDTYAFLEQQGLPMVLRAQNPKRMIVSRR